jgi:hypothetical protein
MEVCAIQDTDALFRRLEEEDFQGDFTLSCLKSSAFSDPFGEPSVHLGRLADFPGLAQRYPATIFYGILEVLVLRRNGFDVFHRPIPSDPSHSVIIAQGGDVRKKSTRRKLKKLVSRLVAPHEALG